MPNKYTISEIKKVLEYLNTNSVLQATRSFAIPKSTIEKWVKKERAGTLTAPTNLPGKKITKGSNSKFGHKFQREVIDFYLINGYSKTLEKYNEVSETSLNRWIAKDRNGELKREKRNEFSIPRTASTRLGRRELVQAVMIEDNWFDNFSNSMDKKFRFSTIKGLAQNDKKISVSFLCKRFNVTQAGYYKWVRNGDSEFNNWDEELAKNIIMVREDAPWAGCRNVRYMLLEWGLSGIPSVSTINRYMRRLGMETIGYTKKNKYKYPKTSIETVNCFMKDGKYDSSWVVRSNQVWSADTTEIISRSSTNKAVKLILIMDVFDRTIISWDLVESSDVIFRTKSLLREAITKYGVPNYFHTDNGVEFKNLDIQSISKEFNFTHSTTAPYSPKQNAFIERLNGRLKNELRSYIHGAKHNDAMKIYNALSLWTNNYNFEKFHQGIKTIPMKKRRENLGK